MTPANAVCQKGKCASGWLRCLINPNSLFICNASQWFGSIRWLCPVQCWAFRWWHMQKCKPVSSPNSPCRTLWFWQTATSFCLVFVLLRPTLFKIKACSYGVTQLAPTLVAWSNAWRIPFTLLHLTPTPIHWLNNIDWMSRHWHILYIWLFKSSFNKFQQFADLVTDHLSTYFICLDQPPSWHHSQLHRRDWASARTSELTPPAAGTCLSQTLLAVRLQTIQKHYTNALKFTAWDFHVQIWTSFSMEIVYNIKYDDDIIQC